MENALTPVDEAKVAQNDGSVQEHSKDLPHLIVFWTPATGTDEAPNLEEVYLGYSGHGGPAVKARGRIEVVGDQFTGDVTLPAENGYQGGSWQFSGPLAASGGRGQFTATGTAPLRRGRTKVGTVYDAGRSLKLRAWVPPGPEPVRGLFIYGNGWGNDDRLVVIDDWWLAFCRLHRFALVATGFYGPDDGATLQSQLSEVARACGHPELESAPILFTGHSNGGDMAWEYNAAHPERVIAFTVSKGGSYSTKLIGDTAMRNPAILILGENDTPERIRAIIGLFAAHLGLGGALDLGPSSGPEECIRRGLEIPPHRIEIGVYSPRRIWVGLGARDERVERTVNCSVLTDPVLRPPATNLAFDILNAMSVGAGRTVGGRASGEWHWIHPRFGHG